MDDTKPKPEQPAEPVDEDAAENDVEAQQRREALVDLLTQIELHGQI